MTEMNITGASTAPHPFRGEHDELLAALGSIDDGIAAAADVAALAEPLTALKATLELHFEHEEVSSFFVAPPPDVAAAIVRLRTEHGEIRARLDRILYVLRNTDAQARSLEALDQIPDQVRELVEAIRAHEHEENAIIQDAYLRDTGVAD